MVTKRRSIRGLSIVDSLIAFTIIVIALAALMPAIPMAFITTNQAAIHIQAVVAAQQYLETTRRYVTANGNVSLPAPPVISIDFGDQLLGTGARAGGVGKFTFGNNACPLVNGSNVRYDCQVTVSWTQAQAQRSVTLETYVTHQ